MDDAKSLLQSKTFWMNLVGVPLFAWLAKKGLPLDPATQDQVIVGGIALANILMRLVTKTPIGGSTATAQKLGALFFGAILLGLTLAACGTTYGLQSPIVTGQAAPAPAAQIQATLQAVQPVATKLACEAQLFANLTGEGLSLAGQAGPAAGSAVASAIAGTFCNGLQPGQALPTPVPVQGTVTLPTATGSVTLPVPVPARVASAGS